MNKMTLVGVSLVAAIPAFVVAALMVIAFLNYTGQASGMMMTVVGLIAGEFNLPQMLWNLFVETGMTAPTPRAEWRFWQAMALGVPASAFCVTFAAASIAPSRPVASVAWLTGGLITLVVVIAGLIVEGATLGRPSGLVTAFLLLASASGAIWLGYRAYLRKDGISQPAASTSTSGGSRFGFGLVAILLVLGVMFLMTLLSYQMVEESQVVREQELRARQAEEVAREREMRAKKAEEAAHTREEIEASKKTARAAAEDSKTSAADEAHDDE